jgi:DNA polymerase
VGLVNLGHLSWRSPIDDSLMQILSIDLETFSIVDLLKCGAHAYAESSDFQILLLAFAFGDEPVEVVDLAQGQPIPKRVLDALFDPNVIKTSYNAAFELVCLSKHLGRPLDVRQWRCTSVHALYLGMPGNLADVGKVMGLPDHLQKMSSGKYLIRYFCMPCKPTISNHGRTRNLPHHDPEKWTLFIEYCRRDVETERFIAKKLSRFPVPDVEWTAWHLDQRMNNHGLLIDSPLVDAAIECDRIFKARLIEEAVSLTGLKNPNSRGQLLEWLQVEEDGAITDLTKKAVPKILANTDSDVVRRVLELRQELAKTSISKFHAMRRSACQDDRIRGLTQFYGANRTGRWAGRLVQVQNLVSNKLPDLDLARTLVRERQFDLVEVLFGNVPDTLSQLVRTAFIAPAGSRLIVVDFSAIEARVIAWLAWCQWRLDVFATHGKIYEASAEQMFHLPRGSVSKKSPARQKGKVAELALGYQGGVGALKTMGALEMGLTEDDLELIKTAWRSANPEIVALWYEIERCAKDAVTLRSTCRLSIAGGRSALEFSWESGFLFITLPSKRRLAYVKPRIESEDLYRAKSDGSTFVVAKSGSLTYEGTDQKTKKWTRLPTYGGKLTENITQAIARDCLRETMLALDERGYVQLMTVHDEDVLEVPSGQGSLLEVQEVMSRPIAWAPGLQLRGDGFETAYYMKEVD